MTYYGDELCFVLMRKLIKHLQSTPPPPPPYIQKWRGKTMFQPPLPPPPPPPQAFFWQNKLNLFNMEITNYQ